MAVFQTSKAGINCLHHQSHQPIYTADKYGKHRPFVLPLTAKIQKPSNILKWMSRSSHLASFPTPLRRSESAPSCSHFLPLITCTSSFFPPQFAPELTAFIPCASSLVALSDPRLSSCIRLKPGAQTHDQTCQ